MTYKEKLKSPKWQRKRLEILQRDEFKCKNCNSDEKTLQIHHLEYNNCEPWEYENRYLITLCEDCHKKEEQLKPFTSNSIEYLTSLGFLRNDISKIVMHLSNKTDSMNDIDTYNYFKNITNNIING
jgi:hypothetical protein